MEDKCKILFVAASTFVGRFFVKPSTKFGHAIFALIDINEPIDLKIVESYKNIGVTFLHGNISDHESMVRAIKQVDIVISTIGYLNFADQIKLIDAIKEAGNVKDSSPLNIHGADVDRVDAVDPVATVFRNRAQIRQAVEAAKIPYAFVTVNCFSEIFMHTLGQGDFLRNLNKCEIP